MHRSSDGEGGGVARYAARPTLDQTPSGSPTFSGRQDSGNRTDTPRGVRQQSLTRSDPLAELRSLKSRLEGLPRGAQTEQLERLQQRVRQLEGDLVAKDKAISAAQAEVDRRQALLRVAAGQARQEVTQLRSENQAAQAELTRANSHIQRLMQEVHQLNSEVAELRAAQTAAASSTNKPAPDREIQHSPGAVDSDGSPDRAHHLEGLQRELLEEKEASMHKDAELEQLREAMMSKDQALEALQKEVQLRAAGSVPLADPQLHELRNALHAGQQLAPIQVQLLENLHRQLADNDIQDARGVASKLVAGPADAADLQDRLDASTSQLAAANGSTEALTRQVSSMVLSMSRSVDHGLGRLQSDASSVPYDMNYVPDVHPVCSRLGQLKDQLASTEAMLQAAQGTSTLPGTCHIGAHWPGGTDDDMADVCAIPGQGDELLAAVQLLRARLHALPASAASKPHVPPSLAILQRGQENDIPKQFNNALPGSAAWLLLGGAMLAGISIALRSTVSAYRSLLGH